MSAVAHLDEERLSLLLDGIGDPEDAAHVAGCERCASRLDALREAVRLVAAAVAPPSGAERDVAVSRALGVASPPVRRHRRRRPRLSERVRGLAAAATVAVVLGGGVAVIVASANSGSSSKSSGATAAPASSADAHGPAEGPGPSGPSAYAGSGSASTASLGSFESVAAVLAELKTSLPGPGSTSNGPLGGVESPVQCSAAAHSAGGSTTVAYQSALTYRDTPAYVFVFDRSDERVAVIVATTGCQVLARATF